MLEVVDIMRDLLHLLTYEHSMRSITKGKRLTDLTLATRPSPLTAFES